MSFFDLPIGWKHVALAVGIPAVAGLISYALLKKGEILICEGCRQTKVTFPILDKECRQVMEADFLRIQVNVPGDKVGAVIGKSGAVVREVS